MTRNEAKQILDRARGGAEISAARINAALIASGDLAPEPSPVALEAERTWLNCGTRVMRSHALEFAA